MANIMKRFLGWLLHGLGALPRFISTLRRRLATLLLSGRRSVHSTQHPKLGIDESTICPYKPNGINTVYAYGSSAMIGGLKPGIVLKAPLESWWSSEVLSDVRQQRVNRLKNSFHVEEKILESLGEHPRITRLVIFLQSRYLGVSEDPDARGLLFGEASHGDLQTYLDNLTNPVDHQLRKKWCRQAVEAVCYIHDNGVIHSDLRPSNFLVDADASHNLNLRLCDFGGSTFRDLDGGTLPDAGFSDPRDPWVSTSATDIFSLGSVIYIIMVGYWPHGLPGSHMFKSMEEKRVYEDKVNHLFGSDDWPSVDGIEGGNIILGCWKKDFVTAQTVLGACRALEW